MASRRGQFFIFIVFILNAVAFLAVPWEKFFFDKEKVISLNSSHLEEVDVKYLEPTGVYVPMTFGESAVKGYQHPTWFHRKLNAYARFYLYTGPVSDRMDHDFNASNKQFDGIPVLISEVIDIPSSGKVKVDMKTKAYPSEYFIKEGLNSVAAKYKLPGKDYYDSATPFCKELDTFKKNSLMTLLKVVIGEVIVLTIVLVIAGAAASKKKKQNAAKTTK